MAAPAERLQVRRVVRAASRQWLDVVDQVSGSHLAELGAEAADRLPSDDPVAQLTPGGVVASRLG